MKHYHLLLSVCSIPKIASAQSESNPDRWEIGVDALSLFGKNSMPAYSLFGRYLINPEGKKEAFLRTSLGYQSNRKILDAPQNDIRFQDSKSESWKIAIGFQKEILSNSSFSFYYGGDLIYQQKIEDESGSYKVNGGEVGWYSYEDLKSFSETRFVGFFGFSTNPTKKIKISLESGIFAGRTSFQQNYLGFYPNSEIAAIGYNSSIRAISGFQPFYQLLFTLTL